jgi:hypothetical protein
MSERETAATPTLQKDKGPIDGPACESAREWISHAFGRVEDVVYIGLGLLLAASAVVLLASGALSFWRSLLGGTLVKDIVPLLDHILLILMIVEILSTVQVSFREHVLTAEPFLIVGLIAGIRHILVLTAEFSQLLELGETAFRNAMIEMGLLTLLVVALVVSLFMLRKLRSEPAVPRS